jgi:phosphate-selective porin
MRVIYVLLFIILASSFTFSQSVQYVPGDGVQIFNTEQQWKLSLLGYIQSTYTFHSLHQNNTVQNSFYVERARWDMIFNYLDKYQIFFEMDGAPNRTALVLAQLDISYLKDHKIEAGKFIVPFSPENNRSSRALSTVERYSALNSMFLLPSFDSQYGIMFYGTFYPINYYFSITNGNAEAAGNFAENNNPKDYEFRLEYNTNSSFNFGGSLDYTTEEKQTLSLVDHTFESFNNVNIKGRRFGYLGNWEYAKNKYLFRGEFFQFNFLGNLSLDNQIRRFSGGYVELGYFVNGNSNDGLQLIGRYENAQYNGDLLAVYGPSLLNSYILGTNWYMDSIFRLQVNLIYEQANNISVLVNRLENKNNEMELLTMLQLKF